MERNHETGKTLISSGADFVPKRIIFRTDRRSEQDQWFGCLGILSDNLGCQRGRVCEHGHADADYTPAKQNASAPLF
jgi:hypothetical protein